MNKPKKTALVLIFTSILLFSGQKIKEKDLSPKYQEWLELVTYIIQPEEKDVFLRLENDRERDIFMDAFWKQRDPTPGTPLNENKEEHVRRFVHANQRYGRSTPRDGWMTDMGRIYIILGEPMSKEIFETSGIYPAEVWTYNGDPAKGLPAQFNLVFFQRSGAGEYKLYNPTSDGPAALIINKQGLDLTNQRALYDKILELAPTLAGPSISLIPGQSSYNYTPSPRNNIILANIMESPRKDINPSYATHFLNYRGIVTTDYLTNYKENHTDMALIQDPISKLNFVHFSISPSSVSIDYFEPKDQYYCNYLLSVSVRKGENLILQYSKDFPFYFDPDRLELIQGKGFALQDSFPLIEGTYSVSILIQNSVGKEFSVFEGDVSVPESSGIPTLIGPVMGYGIENDTAAIHAPFKVLGKKILLDSKSTISLSEAVAFFFSVKNVSKNLWEKGKVEVSLMGLRENTPVQKTLTLALQEYPYDDIIGVFHSIPAKELSPDYYDLILVLRDENGSALEEKRGNCIVSPSEGVPHPVTLAKTSPLANSFLFLYSLANQYDRDGKPENAESLYERAFSVQPDYRPGILEYAHFLLRIKKHQRCLDLIKKIENEKNVRFEYLLLKGMAQMGMENYSAAIDSLLEGNKIYDSDTRLLNSLGICFYKTGNNKRALEVLRASLLLNPDQQNILALVREIEKDPVGYESFTKGNK
jgi:GWxTD domain-containing protein